MFTSRQQRCLIYNRVISSAKPAILLWLCCSFLQVQETASSTAYHEHRTKSTTRSERTKHLTDGLPPVPLTTSDDKSATEVATVTTTTTTTSSSSSSGGGGDTTVSSVETKNVPNTSVLGSYMQAPRYLLKNLMLTSVNALQTGMDTFQSMSAKVYEMARQKVTTDESSSAAKDESSPAAGAKRSKRQIAGSQELGLVHGLGRSVSNIIGTGISGVQEATDLGMLLGNMGTYKIRAALQGKDGNQEVLKLLVQYVGKKVGKGTKGSAVQFIDDVGTIATFVGEDSVSELISRLMEKLMDKKEVAASMVRIAITTLDSSNSTSCLLDRLPLSDTDVRMLFDVFVGSNGQAMLQTIAGILSDLTTGPDTRAFLESVMGMMSMFKSDDSSKDQSQSPAKSTSFYGSLTDFFTGDDGTEEDLPPPPPPPPPVVSKKKKNKDKAKLKAMRKKKFQNPDDDFDDWFDGGGSKTAASKSRKLQPDEAKKIGSSKKCNRRRVHASGSKSGGNSVRSKTVRSVTTNKHKRGGRENDSFFDSMADDEPRPQHKKHNRKRREQDDEEKKVKKRKKRDEEEEEEEEED